MGSPIYNPIVCVVGLGLLAIAILVGFLAHISATSWQHQLHESSSNDEQQQRAARSRLIGLSSGLFACILLCVGISYGLPNIQPRPDLTGRWSSATRQHIPTTERTGIVVLRADGTLWLQNLRTSPLDDDERIAFAEGTWSLEHTWHTWIVHTIVSESSESNLALDFQYIETETARLLCIESDHGNTCVEKEQP